MMNTIKVSDEVCTHSHENYLRAKNQKSKRENVTEFGNYFECTNGVVRIHPVLVCNGHNHCFDGSDEQSCGECPRKNNLVFNNIFSKK